MDLGHSAHIPINECVFMCVCVREREYNTRARTHARTHTLTLIFTHTHTHTHTELGHPIALAESISPKPWLSMPAT